jgi:hypothetical protein
MRWSRQSERQVILGVWRCYRKPAYLAAWSYRKLSVD